MIEKYNDFFHRLSSVGAIKYFRAFCNAHFDIKNWSRLKRNAMIKTDVIS